MRKWFAVFWMFTRSALAAGLEVSPALVDETLRPGEPFDRELRIRNLGHRRSSVSITVLDGWIGEDGRSQRGPAGTHERSIAEWIRVTPESFEALPGRPMSLLVELDPPADAAGAYLAWIVVQGAAETGLPTTRARARIEVPLYIDIPSDGAPASLNIDHTSTSQEGAFDPIFLEAVVVNTGAAMLRPALQAVLMREEAEGAPRSVVGRLEPHQPYPMAPGQRRTLLAEWPGELEPGAYVAQGVVVGARGTLVPIEHPFVVGADGTVEGAAAPSAEDPAGAGQGPPEDAGPR